MKKLLYSVATLGAAAAVAVLGTGAFFSDTETSEDNTFTAGSIDLAVGSQFSSTNNGSGAFDLLSDNNGRTLYTFTDIKPGDMGQGAFSLQVSSNEAYVCAMSDIEETLENTLIEPEDEAGDTTNGVNEGELQNYLQFAIFADQNENGLYDAGEPLNVNQFGGDSNGYTAAELDAAGWIPVADPTAPNTWLVISDLDPGETYKAGFMYCFGDFDTSGVCTMYPEPSLDNRAQTDGISGSIEFMAVQTRNNANFSCAGLNPTPTPGLQDLIPQG